MSTYTTAEIQAVAEKFTIQYASSSISYIGGYICQGATRATEAHAVIGKWYVIFRSYDGLWEATRCCHVESGTTYFNPWKFMARKIKK
jgi:hypothetical protein